jgi:hypothetical protein
MSWINIDVDLDDIYDAMSRYDKEQMAKWLEKDGVCVIDQPDTEIDIEITGRETWDELQFKTALKTLWLAWPRLSPETATQIQNLAKQY